MIERLRLSGGEVELEHIPGDPDRPPLVFLHEGLGSLELWRRFPSAVAAATGRTAVFWSRHGYGRSAVVAEPRSPDYMHHEALAVLPEFLDRLGVGRPVLIGHSDGASIALIHAGGAGRPVSAIVALAPHVYVEERGLAGIRATRENFRNTDLPQRMGRYHCDPATTFWGWNDIWLSATFREWNIEEYLPEVTCPTLLVQCRDDRYGTLVQLDRIERGVAGPVERLVFDSGGHAPHLSHPEVVAGRIAAFLADADGGFEWSPPDGAP